MSKILTFCKNAQNQFKNILKQSNKIIAFRNSVKVFEGLNNIHTNVEITSINKIWDIFLLNSHQIRSDFSFLASKKKTKDLALTNSVISFNKSILAILFLFFKIGAEETDKYLP